MGRNERNLGKKLKRPWRETRSLGKKRKKPRKETKETLERRNYNYLEKERKLEKKEIKRPKKNLKKEKKTSERNKKNKINLKIQFKMPIRNKIKIRSKKAWIRIAEAAIAIMMLASVILVIVGKQVEQQDIGEIMYKLQHNILDEALRNDTIRNAVLSGNTLQINSFIVERLPSGMNFTTKICNPDEICETELLSKEVYVDDVIISSTLQQYQPKKLKFFVWID